MIRHLKDLSNGVRLNTVQPGGTMKERPNMRLPASLRRQAGSPAYALPGFPASLRSRRATVEGEREDHDPTNAAKHADLWGRSR